MSETPQEYKQRIAGQLAGQDPLQVYASTAKRLQRLIKRKSLAKLRRRPAPGKWSIVEILAHLADSEVASAWRIRQIVSSPGALIQAFDQDAWAAACHYEKRDPGKSLAQFAALREANLALLKMLTPEQWNHYGIHAERGKETIAELVRLHAGHDINHILQIDKILAQKKA
jgi:hypothetical protein